MILLKIVFPKKMQRTAAKFSSVRLTHRFVRDKRLVGEAENLGDIVQIWMLGNECPLSVVNEVVEIDDGHLYAPIIFVVGLDVPMDPDGAHMLCAL